MPSSYQAPRSQSDTESKTKSQSQSTNISVENATVQTLLDRKGSDVFSIRHQDTLAHAVTVLRDQRIGALLVMDANGKVEGILSERDIVRKLADTPGKTLPQKVEAVMTKKVETCDLDETLTSVLQRMSNGRFRHMPVVDENGVAGIITIGDVVNFRLVELEQEALQLKQLIVG